MKRTLLRLRERASNAATGVATRSRRKNDDTVQTVGDGGDPTVVLGIVANQSSPNTGAGEESTGNSRRHDVTYFPNVPSINNSDNIARVTGEGEDVVIQRGNSTNAAAGDRRQSGESWGKKMNYLPTHKSKASMDQTETAASAREGNGKERTLVSHNLSHFDDEQRRSMHRRSSIRFADEAAVPVAGDDGMTAAGKDIYLADKRDAIARENRAFRKISTMREERESHERREETYSPEGKHADGPTVSSGTQEYLDVEKRLQTLRRSGHQNGHEKLHLTQDRSREQPQNTVGSTEQQIPRDSEVAVFTRSPKGADHTTTGNSPPEGNTENAKMCNDEGEIIPLIADVRESSLNADPPARIYTGAPAAHALFPASRQSGSRDATNTKEPRAVFVHRASLLEAGKVAMAMGAGHRGSFGSSCAGGVGGGEDGQPFAGECRRPSKPGVGSLPIPS